MSILDPLYEGVARSVVGIHSLIEPVFGRSNGYGWVLSIVLLTLVVRLILFPLFVRSIKSQRAMQLMAPKMKEIKEKYKHDRQRMNEEMMALQREHGNPLLGCLPLLVQIPIFIALYRVLSSIIPRVVTDPASCKGTISLPINSAYACFVGTHGLSNDQAQAMGSAKILGVPLAASFTTGRQVLDLLGTTGPVKLVVVVAVIVLVVTTFIAQKQLQGRSPAPDNPQARMQQRLFLYLAPFGLLVSGTFVPVGAGIYYLTSNVWTLGQQFYVLRRMPVPTPELTTGAERAAARELERDEQEKRDRKDEQKGRRRLRPLGLTGGAMGEERRSGTSSGPATPSARGGTGEQTPGGVSGEKPGRPTKRGPSPGGSTSGPKTGRPTSPAPPGQDGAPGQRLRQQSQRPQGRKKRRRR